MQTAPAAQEQTYITAEQWARISFYDQVGILRMPGVRQVDEVVFVDLAQLSIHQLHRLADVFNCSYQVGEKG